MPKPEITFSRFFDAVEDAAYKGREFFDAEQFLKGLAEDPSWDEKMQLLLTEDLILEFAQAAGHFFEEAVSKTTSEEACIFIEERSGIFFEQVRDAARRFDIDIPLDQLDPFLAMPD